MYKKIARVGKASAQRTDMGVSFLHVPYQMVC